MNQKRFNKSKILQVLVFILISAFTLSGCKSSNNNDDLKQIVMDYEGNELDIENMISDYKMIEVYGGDLSGRREANVVVDIGFGDREYYAFTNEYGQLVKVIAKEIRLQDESKEKVLSTGRYFKDEAKVPGVESPTLDEGHVIADSLGGVSNAYNITPQESTLNQRGDQAYMEKAIQDAKGCTDFVAKIEYLDTKTQIPNHYSFTYTINGNIINDEFDNVNPNEVVEAEIEIEYSDFKIRIIELEKRAEYIIIENYSDNQINLKGWKIVSVRGKQTFTFPEYVLDKGDTVKVGDEKRNPDVDIHWLDEEGTWSNSKSDPAELYDEEEKLVDRFEE